MEKTQILMHASDKVAEVKFDNQGYVSNISKVFNEKLLPLSIKNNPVLDMEKWIMSRSLSSNRKDLASFREFYGGKKFQSANGISLFDSYWFSRPGFNDWDKVNPYDNWNAKKDSLFLMIANPQMLDTIDLNSPNLTVPGTEARFWFKQGDNFYLLYADAQKEVANYRLSGRGNEYVAEKSYALLASNIYAKTPAITSKEVEIIPLSEYYNSVYSPDKSKIENLKTCCETYGLPRWKTFFDFLINYDEEIGNDTRELSDVGILRDTKTLEIINFAPL